MDINTNSSAKPIPDQRETLAPIERLVAIALIGTIAAVVVLVTAAFHVMETTDADALARERVRAAAIADLLVDVTSETASAQATQLGQVAGLKDLRLADTRGNGTETLSTPLLQGELGGQFLTWTPSHPGRDLFMRFAPQRLPLGIGFIASVFVCLLLMLRHVRQIERLRHQAESQALHDHLTGLPNRLALEAELARLAAGGRGFSVLAMDLDRFKPINDRFGHDAGDQALIAVSQRLLAQLRPGEMLARIGGDEFVAIVLRGGQRAALADLARGCIEVVGAPLLVTNDAVTVGVSIGIVADANGDAVLKLADRALYEAKRLKDGAYRFAGDEFGPIEMRAAG